MAPALVVHHAGARLVCSTGLQPWPHTVYLPLCNCCCAGLRLWQADSLSLNSHRASSLPRLQHWGFECPFWCRVSLWHAAPGSPHLHLFSEGFLVGLAVGFLGVPVQIGGVQGTPWAYFKRLGKFSGTPDRTGHDTWLYTLSPHQWQVHRKLTVHQIGNAAHQPLPVTRSAQVNPSLYSFPYHTLRATARQSTQHQPTRLGHLSDGVVISEHGKHGGTQVIGRCPGHDAVYHSQLHRLKDPVHSHERRVVRGDDRPVWVLQGLRNTDSPVAIEPTESIQVFGNLSVYLVYLRHPVLPVLHVLFAFRWRLATRELYLP